ncbi:MAG: ATP-binding protein [Myxococcota bacterium]
MRRVYLWVWCGVVGIVADALAVNEWLAYSEAFGDEATAYHEQYIGPSIHATAAAVDAAPDDPDLQARLDEWWSAPVDLLDAAPPRPPPEFRLSGPIEAWWTVDADQELLWIHTPGGAWLRVGPLDLYPEPDLRGRAWLGGLVLLAVTLATLLLLWPLDRAQRAMARTARAIHGGELSARVEEADFTAAPDMGRAFNAMAERVERLVDARQRVLGVASHELRTPIARLRIAIHLLATDPTRRPEREAALDADLEELDAIVDVLLTHARLHDGTRPPRRVETPIADVLAGLVDTLDLREGLTLEAHVRGVTVTADRVLFRRVVRNLLSNAVRYARSRVVVRAYDGSDRVRLVVEDDGPGIDAARHDEARAVFGTLDGRSEHGLGLAIVDEVVGHHGGTLELSRSELGGLCATTSWPQGD